MTSNNGKYIDRSPYICPAGKVFGKPFDTVRHTLNEFSDNDKIEALQHDAKIWKKDEFVEPVELRNALNPNFKGTETEIKSVLQPGVKTRYATIMNDLSETVYKSYWRAPLGKVRDPVPNLPAGMDPETVTFGTPSKRETTAKELLNPPKTVYEVLYDSQVAHDWYVRTHNDYNPGEQVNRKYAPPFQKDQRYGEKYNYDPRGRGAQRATTWFMLMPYTICNKIKTEYDDKWKASIGCVLTPNNNEKLVPPGHTYGKQSRWDKYGVEDLLKNVNLKPCEFKKQFLIWIQSLISVRDCVKRLKKHDFNMDTFLQEIVYNDQQKTGFITVDDLVDKFLKSRVTFNVDHIIKLCIYSNILNTENMLIDYCRFCYMVDPRNPLIDFKKIQDIPAEHLYYLTTYQAATCDRLEIDNSVQPVAGAPSRRIDKVPRKLDGQTNSDIDNLGNDTNAKAVISPNIYTHYGLTYRDFYKPRKPEVIKTLFEKLGYNFPENSFEEFWNKALEIDKTGLVCVETFRNVLRHCYPELKPVLGGECSNIV